MKDKLNIYKKIQKVRTDLVDLNLKKTGHNKHLKYNYFELGDFLPGLNRLMNETGIMTVFNIHPQNDGLSERAILKIVDTDEVSKSVEFEIETAEAIGSKNPIQSLGSKITYLRRYMLMIAFEISDNDSVDSAKPVTKAEIQALEITPEQAKEISDSKDLEELASVCKAMKTKLGDKYQKSLVRHYTSRKNNIEALVKKEEVKKEEPVEEKVATKETK